MLLALEVKFNVVFEGNNLQVIQLMQATNDCFSPVGSLIEELKLLEVDLHQFLFILLGDQKIL